MQSSQLFAYTTLFLSRVGEQSVVPDLLELLRDSQVDTEVRRAIISALGSVKEPGLVPDLLMLLKDPQVDTSRSGTKPGSRSEEHTSELQSLRHLVCRL